MSENLDSHNVVIDIGYAHSSAQEVLKELGYKNLDELAQFKGHLTTTEFLAKYIHDRMKEETKAIFSGRIKVTLGETHDAWASYMGS